MTDTAEPPAGLSVDSLAYCLNCNFVLGDKRGNFCPNCGQETARHPAPVGQLARRYAAEYLLPGGRFFRTLALLLFRPGELTRRYFAGRKRSYLRPLRLYFGASLIFFLVVKIFGAGNFVRNEVGSAARDQAAALSSGAGETKPGLKVSKAGPIGKVKFDAGEGDWDTPFLANITCSKDSVQCLKIRAYMHEKYGDAPLRVVGAQVRDRVIGYAPNAMFAMLPVFALFTWILYWRRKIPYGDHFVYALHVHSFAFLLLLALARLPSAIGDWLSLAGMIYFAVAMQRVFDGRKWATVLRYALIGICYPILLSIVILLTLAAAVLI